MYVERGKDACSDSSLRWAGQGMRMATGRGSTEPSVQGPEAPWAGLGCVSPGRDVGGEGGALVGVHELGCSCYIFPLGLFCSSCNRSRNGLGDSLQNVATELAKRLRAKWTRAEAAHLDAALSTPVLPHSPPPPGNLQHLSSGGHRAFHGGHGLYFLLFPPGVARRMAKDRTEKRGHLSPMTLQSRRRLVVSPSPLSRGLSVQEGGSGIRSPMGRWNFRRRGSTVTMGLNVAWLPRSLVTSSSGTG